MPTDTNSESPGDSLSHEGFDVECYRGKDGVMVLQIDTICIEPRDENSEGSPMFRIWVNDALVYSEGKAGDDLDLPNDYQEKCEEQSW